MATLTTPGTLSFRAARFFLPGLLLAVFALSLSMPVQSAEVYKSVDREGNATYTDDPAANTDAEPVEVPEPNTVPATPIPYRGIVSKDSDPADFKISISQPTDQQRFPNRLAGITVQVSVTPTPEKRYRVRLLLNGAVHSLGSKEFTIDQLPQGESTLKAELLNEFKKVISESPTITIYAAQPG